MFNLQENNKLKLKDKIIVKIYNKMNKNYQNNNLINKNNKWIKIKVDFIMYSNKLNIYTILIEILKYTMD